VKCEKYCEWMSLYFDRELDQIFVEDLLEHLSLCKNCMAVFRTMEKTITLFRSYYKCRSCRVPKKVTTQVFYRLQIIYEKHKI